MPAALTASATDGPAPWRSGVLRGAAFMALSTSCLAIDAGLIRVTSRTVHVFGIVFWRNLFSFLLLLPWILGAGATAFLTNRLATHLLRSALKLISMCALFFAVKSLPLADVTAISFTAPFFVAVGAWLILGEHLPVGGWLATAVGFGGVLIVVRPGAGVFNPMMVIALLSAVTAAAIIIVVKFLTPTEPSVRIVALNLALSVVMAGVVAVPVWTLPGLATLGLLAVQGLLGLVSQTSIVRAMGLADASLVMPIEFLRLPLVILIGSVAFGERVELASVLGGMVIFVASVWLVRVGMRRRLTEPAVTLAEG